MKGVCLVAEEGRELESKSHSAFYVSSAVSLSCPRDFIACVHGMKKCDCFWGKKIRVQNKPEISKPVLMNLWDMGRKTQNNL